MFYSLLFFLPAPTFYYYPPPLPSLTHSYPHPLLPTLTHSYPLSQPLTHWYPLLPSQTRSYLLLLNLTCSYSLLPILTISNSSELNGPALTISDMLIPDLTLFCMPPFYILLFQNLLHENMNITHSYMLYKLLQKLPNSFFNQIFYWTQKVLSQIFFQSKFFSAHSFFAHDIFWIQNSF